MWVLQCRPRGDKMMAFRPLSEMTGRSLRQQSAGKKVLDEGAVHNGSTQPGQRRLYSQTAIRKFGRSGLATPPPATLVEAERVAPGRTARWPVSLRGSGARLNRR